MSGAVAAAEMPKTAVVTDEELVAAFRNGSDEAWMTLLSRYSGFILSAAHAYARICRPPDAREAREDTAGDLYLCMTERIRESILHYYRGECRLKTWIYRLVSDRRQIVKAFLMKTSEGRHRADTRLPRSIQCLPQVYQKAYRRLVWGKEPAGIAADLHIPESEARRVCGEILALLQSRSPRVYRRIIGNRRALVPLVSLDAPVVTDDGERIATGALDPGPLPDEITEQRALMGLLPRAEGIIRDALACVPEDDVRLLELAFDFNWSLAEIVENAAILGFEGISVRHQADYRITRAVRRIALALRARIGGTDAGDGEEIDEIIIALKALFRERGVLSYLAPSVPIVSSVLPAFAR